MEKIRNEFELEWSCSRWRGSLETRLKKILVFLHWHSWCMLLAASVCVTCGAAYVSSVRLDGQVLDRNGGEANPGEVWKRSEGEKQRDVVRRACWSCSLSFSRRLKESKRIFSTLWSGWHFVKKLRDRLCSGTCRGLWTRTRRRETRARRWRSAELTLRRRRNISPSWMLPDTRASSPTWLVGRRRLTWLCWWGQGRI